MKIRLKDKKTPIRKGDTYGGFGSKISAILNSGGIAEVDNVPDISKDLVMEVKAKSKETNDGS